jgi:hypothetical protein
LSVGKDTLGKDKVTRKTSFLEEVKTTFTSPEQELKVEVGVHELVEAGGVPLKEHEMEMDLGDDDDRHTIAETVITEGGVRLVEAEKEGDEEPEREVVKMEPEQEHGTAVERRFNSRKLKSTGACRKLAASMAEPAWGVWILRPSPSRSGSRGQRKQPPYHNSDTRS